MTTVLVSTAYKAASKANKNREKVSHLPVAACLLVRTHNGRILITPFRFEEQDKYTEELSARVENEFATCVPARPFIDWLRASQPAKGQKYSSELLELSFDETSQILKIKTYNTRAEFKCIDAQEFPPC